MYRAEEDIKNKSYVLNVETVEALQQLLLEMPNVLRMLSEVNNIVALLNRYKEDGCPDQSFKVLQHYTNYLYKVFFEKNKE